MSYVDPNYASKKDFKAAVAAGVVHRTYNPSSMLTNLDLLDLTNQLERNMARTEDDSQFIAARTLLDALQEIVRGVFPTPQQGSDVIEGPHYPKPHKWYARVQVKDGKVVKVTG